MPMIAPTAKLIRYAGKKESAKEWKEVQEWFERMTLTGIIGGIYRAKQKHYADGFVGTLFSHVVVAGKAMRNGELAQTNYVWVSPWFLANYFHHHLRPVDLSFHQRLRKPIAKASYPILETGWYASSGKFYSKRYRELCAEFLLTEHSSLSLIKQQLDPAYQELAEERFLAKWDYRESADKSDYIITYYPGKKFFEDQKAKEERRQKVEQIVIGERQATTPKAPPAEEQRSRQESEAQKALLVEDILRVTGDPQSAVFYTMVARKMDSQTIHRAIAETKEASRNGEIRTTRARYFTDLVPCLASSLAVYCEQRSPERGVYARAPL